MSAAKFHVRNGLPARMHVHCRCRRICGLARARGDVEYTPPPATCVRCRQRAEDGLDPVRVSNVDLSTFNEMLAEHYAPKLIADLARQPTLGDILGKLRLP